MDWNSLTCTYLKFDKEELVNRWPQMSNYLKPVNDVEIEFDHGQQKITIYKISKGSLFYHGSTVQIKDFDRIAFFSPHREISKTILSLMAKKFITYPITSQKAYLYTLRAKKDLYIVYNKNMGIGPGYAGQYSPFFKDQPIPEFCEMYHWVDGFYDFRDAAPLFPIFALNMHKNEAQLEREIGLLNDDYFVSNYFRYGSDRRNDPVYTAEFIFCRPNDSLEIVETEELDSRIMLDYWMDTSKKWLQEMMDVPISERDTWSMVKKYEFAVGPKFPVIENIYNRRYFVFKNCIYTFDDIPTIINQKTSKFFVTDIDLLSDKKIIDFWVYIFSKCLVINFTSHVNNIIKNILPEILLQKPRSGLELMLWLCLYVKAQKTTKTYFNNFRKELLALL